MVARFGEIIWAKSAEKGHWWPSLIFDPRSFLGNPEVVALAKKYLGKRYLVYFFETLDSFGAIQEQWIHKWEEGMKRHYDTGKVVQGASKKRIHRFRQALEAAKTALEDSTFNPESDTSSDPEDSDQIIDGAQNFEAEKPSPQIEGSVDWDSGCQHENPTNQEESVPLESQWLSVRDWALLEMARSRDEAPVQIDDETSRGITMRSSGKWQAQLYFHGKSRYIGMFNTREEAALAFKLVRTRLMPKEGEAGSNSLSRNQMHPPIDTASEGAVQSSFSNLFSRQHSPKQLSTPGIFNDKRPNRTKYLSGRKIDSQKREVKNRVPPNRQERHGGHIQRNTRLKDHERTLLVRSTPFCQFYATTLAS
jgi:hypothetical protein